MTDRLPLGKLSPELLTELLGRHGARSRRVLTPPAVGEDAAAVLNSLPCTVVAMDPVSADAARLGHLVVHRNANDVATRGADPAWFLFTLLLPAREATAERVGDIFRQVDAACREVGAELIGGHTEITDMVEQPVAVGTMIGEITTFRLTSTRNARVGNAIVMMGACGAHGAGLLAAEHGEALRRRDVPEDVLARAAVFAEGPSLSVVPAARIALGAAHPHAMHDPTDGGLATALHELASAAQTGIEVSAEAVLVLDDTRAICTAAGLDPWALRSDGTLLVCVDAVDVAQLLEACERQGLQARRIGTVCDVEAGVQRVAADGSAAPLPRPARDERLRFIARERASGR